MAPPRIVVPGRALESARSLRRTHPSIPEAVRSLPVRGRRQLTASRMSVKTPSATPREQGCAVGRTLVGSGSLKGQVEHRGHDLEPEGTSSAAARDPPDLGGAAEPAQQLERVAQAVGDALEHGPRQGAAIVAEGQADEGATRVRVRMRCPFAGEVREEHDPLGARLPALRLRVEALVRRAGARRLPGTSSTNRPPRASRPSHAMSPARHGRRRERAPRGRPRTPPAARRRRPRSRGRRKPGPACRRRRRRPPQPGRRRPRPRSTRMRAATTRVGSREPRAPRRSSGGGRHRRAASPKRPRRRWRARRSTRAERSPWEGARARSARTRPAHGAGARGASVP